MKNGMIMKRFLWIILILTILTALSGCGQRQPAPTPAPTPTPSQEPVERIASIEIYNRTGKIQREDFYQYKGDEPSVSYSVEYSYTDAGRLSSIVRNGGGLGENRPIETYFYSGDNCTQRILYDSNGSTQTVYYWTYDRKNILQTEKIVSMLPAENGYTYSGKKEELTSFNPDGTPSSTRVSTPGDYSLNEYEYGQDGRLLVDRFSHSSDGKTFRVFETRTYAYDSGGRLIRQTLADALGSVTMMEVIEYDEAGSILTDTSYSSEEAEEENITVRKTYTYDAAGILNCVEETSGADVTRTFYEYQASGKPSITTEFRFTGDTMTDKTVTTVSYDARLNPVRETVRFADGSTVTNYSCSYSYYDDGKIRTKTNYEV